MLSTSAKVKIKKIDLRKNRVTSVEDVVAVEAPIKIHVNGKHAVTLFSLPRQLKELGVGWLLSQAIVKSIDDIIDVNVKENNVKIYCSHDVGSRLKVARNVKLIYSSCGSTTEDHLFLIDRMTKPSVDSDYSIEAEKIVEFVKILNEKATLFKLTGGTHSAAIYCNEKLVAFAEDVGRHNAVDKVIGAAFEKEVEFSKCVIVSSGRQSANMVLKAARIGIPIVASIAGPILSGVNVALKTGVTLICFVRGRRLNVYSHPERVKVTTRQHRTKSKKNKAYN